MGAQKICAPIWPKQLPRTVWHCDHRAGPVIATDPCALLTAGEACRFHLIMFVFRRQGSA